MSSARGSRAAIRSKYIPSSMLYYTMPNILANIATRTFYAI